MLANLIKIFSLIVLLFLAGFWHGTRLTKEDYNVADVGTVLNGVSKNLPIEAKSACVYDVLKEDFVFEKNLQSQLPLASLTKLMTVVAAVENFPSSLFVEITKEAISQEGDSGFILGERWNLADLLRVMLVSSSNDAAFAIADSLKEDGSVDDSYFIKLMNRKAAELGLLQTYFLSATGLDLTETLAGAYGSCEDVVKLMNYIIGAHREIIDATAENSISLNGRDFKNTNMLLDKLPVYFGGKTGFSDLSGGNLVVVLDKGFGHSFIIAVLGSSYDGRFKDVEILYNEFVK